MKIATFHYPEQSVEVHTLSNGLGFVLLPEQNTGGYLLSFRGGTGKFGKLELNSLYQTPGEICARTGLAILCPEYGDNDKHVGTLDLRQCALALNEFKSLYPKLSFEGSIGYSRGSTQAWHFLEQESSLEKKPLILWCPVFDFTELIKERPDMAKLFTSLEIDEVGLKMRSASHSTNLEKHFSKLLVLGAANDTRVPVHHAIEFAERFNTRAIILQDEHCFPNRKKDAIEATVAFLEANNI